MNIQMDCTNAVIQVACRHRKRVMQCIDGQWLFSRPALWSYCVGDETVWAVNPRRGHCAALRSRKRQQKQPHRRRCSCNLHVSLFNFKSLSLSIFSFFSNLTEPVNWLQPYLFSSLTCPCISNKTYSSWLHIKQKGLAAKPCQLPRRLRQRMTPMWDRKILQHTKQAQITLLPRPGPIFHESQVSVVWGRNMTYNVQ